jgi:hypothetical protein
MHPEWDKGTPHKHGTTTFDASKQKDPAWIRKQLIASGGWNTEEDIQNAMAIIGRESARIPDRENFEGRDVSYGLFQINMKNDWNGGQMEDMGKRRLKDYAQYGINNYWDLYDPVKNAKAAWAISSQGKQFKGWSTAKAAGLDGPFGNPRGKNRGVVGAVEGLFNKGADAVGDATNWVSDKASGIFSKVKDTADIANALKSFLEAITKEFPAQLKLAGVREAGGPVTTNGASGSGAYNINYGGVTIQVTGSGNWDEKKLAQ